jgi:hypothetical protein
MPNREESLVALTDAVRSSGKDLRRALQSVLRQLNKCHIYEITISGVVFRWASARVIRVVADNGKRIPTDAEIGLFAYGLVDALAEHIAENRMIADRLNAAADMLSKKRGPNA